VTHTPIHIRYINGNRLTRALIAGIQAVIDNQEHLNTINVFPVADKDTGTNLAMTLKSILHAIQQTPLKPLPQLLHLVTDAALNGSRGNSGAIFAQFFVGLGQHSSDKTWNIKKTAHAISSAIQYATSAVTEPKPGTILSVMQAFSDTFSQYAEKTLDILEAWKIGLKQAKISLKLTATQLDACRKASVVDAGAQGFVDFLMGIDNFLRLGSLHHYTIPSESDIEITIPPEVHAVDDGFRYCTECLIEGDQINHPTLRKKLSTHGDSIVLAGHSKKTKLHIHTNNPNAVFELCREFGTIHNEKADDMIHQQSAKHKSIAILTDSSADFPQSTTKKYHIHVVPLGISFGEKTYTDKFSLSPKQFYEKMANDTNHPASSQPSAGDYKRSYEYLSSHYDAIIAIHLPEKHSGTLQASRLAAQRHTPDNFPTTVIDAGTISGGQGLLVTLAAKASNAGYKFADIIQLIDKHKHKIRQYAAVPDLRFAVRGGRVPAWKQKILHALRLTPVLSFNDTNRIRVCKLIIGKKYFAKKFAKFIQRQLNNTTAYTVIIEHCNNLPAAKTAEKCLKSTSLNITQCSIIEASPALGIHAGVGTLGIAYQEDITIHNHNAHKET